MTQSTELPQYLNSKIEEAETHFLNDLSRDFPVDNDSFVTSDTVAKPCNLTYNHLPDNMKYILEDAKTDDACSIIYERYAPDSHQPRTIEINKLEQYIKLTWDKWACGSNITTKKYSHGKLIEEVRIHYDNYKYSTYIEYYPGYETVKSKKQYAQKNSNKTPVLHCDETDEPAYIEYYENGQIKLEKYCYNGELSRHKNPALIEYSEDGKIIRTERTTCMGM